jgi:hypothetical protein
LKGLLNAFTTESKVDIPRIMHGERQSVETLINEETLLLAKYLRGENETWIPRIPSFPVSSIVECQVTPHN